MSHYIAFLLRLVTFNLHGVSRHMFSVKLESYDQLMELQSHDNKEREVLLSKGEESMQINPDSGTSINFFSDESFSMMEYNGLIMVSFINYFKLNSIKKYYQAVMSVCLNMRGYELKEVSSIFIVSENQIEAVENIKTGILMLIEEIFDVLFEINSV